ncbi:hypothetical protein COEREDRAFT_39471, partial [Coemansia reversa NRRL 1564]
MDIHTVAHQQGEKRHSWTDEEDRLLKEYVAKNGTSWTKLAAALGMKGSPMKLRSRWRLLQTVKEKSWSNDEDADLIKAIHEYMQDGHVLGDNGSWVAVADKLQTGRTPSQCYKRWTDALLPRQGRAPWLLIDSGLSGYRLRNFWVYVASRVGTRTPAQCSRKWNSL